MPRGDTWLPHGCHVVTRGCHVAAMWLICTMYSLIWRLACQYEVAADMLVRGGRVRGRLANGRMTRGHNDETAELSGRVFEDSRRQLIPIIDRLLLVDQRICIINCAERARLMVNKILDVAIGHANKVDHGNVCWQL
ncbi:hypothetical protein Tco_1487993 [Tanacetum coccineum]